jgi:hypothetical protein
MEERVLIASMLYSIICLPPHIEMKKDTFPNILEESRNTNFSNEMMNLQEELARLKSKHELVKNQIVAIRIQSKYDFMC